MATKKKEKRAQLKMTDSKWEQAFIISHLPSFVEARVDDYPKGKEYARIGNWCGVRGDMQTINSLMTDATQVEAFGSLNAAQASVLMPRVAMSKVPSAFARSMFDRDPRSKGKKLPLQVPLKFPEHASDAAKWASMVSTTFDPETRIVGAGIQDISVEQKFGSPGVSMSTVDITFAFDSMRTFVSNQKKGLGFLDLIPTDKATIETNGIMHVLWYLQMSIGWNVPNGYDSLFGTPQGKQALEAIEETVQTWTLGYGGEHDISIKTDGSVELKIKYVPMAQARDIDGMNSGMRADILGQTKSSTSGEYRQKVQEQRDALKEQKTKVASLRDKFTKMKTQRQQELAKIQDQALKAQKAAEQKYLSANPPEFVLMEQMGYKPDPKLNPDKPDDLKKIQQGYAEWKASTQISTIGTDLDFGYGDGPSRAAAATQLKASLKTATDSWDTKLNAASKEKDSALKEIQAIQAAIQTLRDHPAQKADMEDRYASFIRDLFFKGHLHYLSLSPEEQKMAAHGARKVSTAHAWFTGKGVNKIQKGWHGTMKERIGVGDGSKEIGFKEQDLSKASAMDFDRAVHLALKNPPDTSKLMTAAIHADRAALDSTSDGNKINHKRIYWFYLGDLMDVVMNNYYNNMKNEEVTGGQKRDAFEYDSLVLSDFYYNTYPKNGKPRKKKPAETVISRAYNLGDFPISLSAFTKFFAERFVSAGYTAISLEAFLEEMVVYLFGSESFTATNQQCWGPFLNPYLPAQRFDMFYDSLTTPVKLERGPAQHFKVGGFYDTTHPAFRQGPGGKSWRVPPDQANATGNGDGQLYNYFCLGADAIEGSPSRPAFTVFLGTDTSFVKDVRYTQQKHNEHLRTEAILKGAASGNGLLRLGNMMMYEVELTCMGSPFFKTGQCFELNNNVFGMAAAEADPLDAFGDSLDDLLPRIIIVTEVNHKFSNGVFETKVKAMASGTSYKDFKEGRSGALISNLPRPGTGKTRAGNSGKGAGRLGTIKGPFVPKGPGKTPIGK